MLYVVGLGLGDKKDDTVKGLWPVHGAVRRVRLGCSRTWALSALCADNDGRAREVSCMISFK